MDPMRARKRIVLGLAALLSAAAGAAASAQPLQLPGAQPFNAPGTQQAAPPAAGTPAAPRQPSLPALKIAGEEAILGKALHHNGNHGAASFEKLGSGYGLKLSLDGYQSANLVEPCAVSLGEAPIPVTALGRPAGVPRYQLEAPVCPLVFDVLDGAFLVVEPTEPCVVEAAQCRVDPRGLWGPDLATVAAQAKAIERARGAAERALRDGYRTLAAKANAVDQRTHEVELGLGGRWKCDFDFLESNREQHVVEAQLALDIHRIGERLIPVAQVSRQPAGRFRQPVGRPAAIRQFDRRYERTVFYFGIGQHDEACCDVRKVEHGRLRSPGSRQARRPPVSRSARKITGQRSGWVTNAPAATKRSAAECGASMRSKGRLRTGT